MSQKLVFGVKNKFIDFGHDFGAAGNFGNSINGF